MSTRIAGRDNGRPGYVTVDRPYRRWVPSDSADEWDRELGVVCRPDDYPPYPLGSSTGPFGTVRLILTVVAETAFLFAFLIALYLAIVLVAT